MPYTPDPYSLTTPLDSEDASTAAAEFRSIKTHLTSKPVTALALSTNLRMSHRHQQLTVPTSASTTTNVYLPPTSIAVVTPGTTFEFVNRSSAFPILFQIEGGSGATLTWMNQATGVAVVGNRIIRDRGVGWVQCVASDDWMIWGFGIA